MLQIIERLARRRPVGPVSALAIIIYTAVKIMTPSSPARTLIAELETGDWRLDPLSRGRGICNDRGFRVFTLALFLADPELVGEPVPASIVERFRILRRAKAIQRRLYADPRERAAVGLYS